MFPAAPGGVLGGDMRFAMAASAVVGPAAVDAMQRRLMAQHDSPAVADAPFPPGRDIAVAIVTVVVGRW